MARHADPTNVPDNDYFVITTNVDHCFQKAGFDKKRLFYTQGDYGLFQCSEPCCQETFDNEAAIREMVAVDKEGDEDRVDNRYGSRLRRCEVTGEDSAEDDQRH